MFRWNSFQKIRYPEKNKNPKKTKWASDEFKALKDSTDEYLIENKTLEAERWADQFDKIYTRTNDGFEKKDGPGQVPKI